MGRKSFVNRLYLGGLLTLSLIGCVSKDQIPQDRLKDYALLVPRQNDNSIVSAIDGKSPGLSLSGATVNLLPGRHTVETTSCFGGTNTCKPDLYTFDAQPGLAYVFRSPTAVEVYNRFGMDKLRVDLLRPVPGRGFVTDRDYIAMQDKAMQQKMDAVVAISEQRRRNLPKVRKIGARICREHGAGIVYVGYVEAMTDDKVQIRVADAMLKGSPGVRPGGFAPSIIWDSPLEWDLCE